MTAWLLVALLIVGLAWYPCCNPLEPECLGCDEGTRIDPLPVTFTGFDDGICDCDTLIDGTYFLPAWTYGEYCRWRLTDVMEGVCELSIFGDDLGYSVTAELDQFAPNARWNVKLNLYDYQGHPGFGPQQLWEWLETQSSGSIDCEAYYDVPFSQVTTKSGEYAICDDEVEPTCEINA